MIARDLAFLSANASTGTDTAVSAMLPSAAAAAVLLLSSSSPPCSYVGGQGIERERERAPEVTQ